MSSPAKPQRMEVFLENIPDELKRQKRWNVWNWVKRDGEPTKPPYQVNGDPADSSDPATWTDFETVLTAYQSGKWDGIGFMLAGSGYTGIDRDNCVSPTGEIDPVVLKKIEAIDSYTEVSPSGTGLKTLLRGKLPGKGHHKKFDDVELGVFDTGRYFCITGHVLPIVSANIESRQAQLDALVRRYWPEDYEPKQKQPQKQLSQTHVDFPDQKFIEYANSGKDAKLRRLWEGDISEYDNDDSRADEALCCKLAYYTNNNYEQIDLLFRQSGLMREKWDREDYRVRTITKAIELTTTVREQKDNLQAPTTTAPNFSQEEPYDIFGESILTGKPGWPQNACPKVLDNFARDEAERIGVEIPMVAIPAIGVAAIAISDRFKIQPKEHDDTWTEDPVPWLAMIADPGQKKSPALKAAKKPLDKIAYELPQAHLDNMGQYTRELEQWKKNGEEGAPPAKPVQRRLYVDDITVEALRKVLGDNPDGVGIIKDELSGWIASFDIYRNGKGGSKDRADYCELYQGGPKLFDRAENGHVHVEHWGASIIGGIQPGPVRRLMGNITDDGLIARFMVAHCEKAGKGSDREPNRIALGAYHGVIKRLTELKPKSETERFVFSHEAQAYRHIIRDLAESVMALPDTSDALKAHLNKWEGAFCRIALVFHIVESTAGGEYPARIIPQETARMAATLMADFFLPNSIRFYSETIDDGSQSAHARWVAGYILSEKLETIAKRDLQRVHKVFQKQPNLMAVTMRALYAANWVDEAAHKRNGEVTSWTVNPRVHTKFSQLAENERARRAEEREKIRKAVDKFRRARVTS